MGLYLVEIYSSPNIGVFLKANDRFLLLPKGIAPSKAERFALDLGVSPCYVSVGGTRLLGPLVAMNNKGIVVSRLVEDYELREIEAQTGLKAARLASKHTAVGNLVAANDTGAIVSPLLDHEATKQVEEALGVTAQRMAIHDFSQVGAMVVATDSGVAIYPDSTEREIAEISSVFKTEVHPTSVNGGVPFPASAIVANSKNAIVGNLTTGPELVFLTRALKV